MGLEQTCFELRRLGGFCLSVGVAGALATAITFASGSHGGRAPAPQRAWSDEQLRQFAGLSTDEDESASSVATVSRGPAPLTLTDGDSFSGRFGSSFGEHSASFSARFATPGLRASSTPAPGRDGQAPSAGPRRENARQAMLTPAPKAPSGSGVTGPVTIPADKRGDSILASLGERTAIYDISARVVYLPNGDTLEAHSGLGEHIDNPGSVHVKMRGSTPPNIYALSMRERPFHGVRALRLTPADPDKMFGRDGILAHSYLLGPNGDSNGCVSVKDYKKFLQAYLDGDIERLVVVDNLAAPPSSATAVGWLSEKVKALFRSS